MFQKGWGIPRPGRLDPLKKNFSKRVTPGEILSGTRGLEKGKPPEI